MPFRYSGSKRRLLKYLPSPPAGTHTIVEPYAGSAAYGLAHAPAKLAIYDANQDVQALWRWLTTTATARELEELEAKKPSEKIDVRELKLDLPQQTLMRLSISGVYVGQLSSWVLYPQHSLKLDKVKAVLPYVQKSVQVLNTEDEIYPLDGDGALFFIDPPYLGTKANYFDKGNKNKDLTKAFTIESLMEMIGRIKSPIILTYGDGAPEIMPEFEWELATIRKVPVIRKKGVVLERSEWFARINWPHAKRH